MTENLSRFTPPLDFRFLDLFVVLVLSLGGFAGIAILLGIGGSFVAPLEVASGVMSDATLNQPFKFEFIARGGKPSYRWKFEGLPQGIDQPDSGVIGGAPNASGVFRVKARVIDQAGATASRELEFRVIDRAAVTPLHFRTSQLPPARVGTHYDLALAVEGGVLPYTWTAKGIPEDFGVRDGTLAGSPVTAGIYTVLLTVTDFRGEKLAKQLDLQILPARMGADQEIPPLRVLTRKMPSAIAGMPFSFQLASTGGRPPYQWQMLTEFPNTRLSLQGLLATNDPAPWVDGAAFIVRVFDQDSNVATASLAPTVIRTDNRLLEAGLAVTALGSWLLLLLVLRVGGMWNMTYNSSDSPFRLSAHHMAFLAIGFLLSAASTVVYPDWGTLIFAFIAAGTAASLLVQARPR